MPDGSLLFTLGDVSGKGISAALLMASIQASMRSLVVSAPDSVADLIGKFNKTARTFATVDKYSTLFCGLLDINSRKLTYVNAGQVRPMLLRSGNAAIERLDCGGFPLGLLEDSEYEQGEVSFMPGDWLFCFSDGISEATNDRDQMWDEARIERIICGCHGLTAQETIDRVIEAADRFAGDAEQADDMTAVAIRSVAI